VPEDIADRVAAVIRRSRRRVTKITLMAPDHRALYETMPGFRLPYSAIDWSRRTLMFQGVPVVVQGGGVHVDRVQ
jgi:hypothetical protein